MNETEFKVLVHGNTYVDERLLSDGIYGTDRPILYTKDETLDILIENVRLAYKSNLININIEPYIENLKQCKLVDVSLQIK